MKREESFVTNLAKLYVLLILSRGPCHGYDIMKDFREATGKALSCGQVYPLLSAMQKRGIVEFREALDGKRKRKIYSLTQSGTAFAADLRGKIMRLLHIQ